MDYPLPSFPSFLMLYCDQVLEFGTGFALVILFTHVLLNIKVMKKLITTAIILAMFATLTTVTAQNRQDEYLGLPGDNLNLYAVMKLFQESETLEGFEKILNDENSRINNLDLNGDNFVDYINVIDYVDGDVHNIVMQVAINNKENQDIGVFTVQRFNNGQVQIQLIGDEELYGKNYIIEPIFDEEIAGQTPNPGYIGNGVTVVRTNTYEIATWPVIRFIYLPSYRPWRSVWYWGYYPSYWHPWTPFYWHYYYGYHYNWYDTYYRHYRRWDHPRYTRWNDFYYNGHRSHSSYVSINVNSGNYKSTYSKPEQRRQGEALYTRTAANQSTRREGQSTVNTSSRRVATESNQNRQVTGTGTGTSRRTSTTVNRSSSNPASDQNSGTARRSTTTVSSRPATSTAKGQSTSTARRSSTTVSSRSTAAPKPSQSAAKSRSTANPATGKASPASRRSSGSSGNSKSSTASKNSEKKKETTPAKPARRK